MVRECGGSEWKENIDAAGRHATKCLLMAGKWVRYNSMEERWEFLRMKSSCVETFTKAWSLHEIEATKKKGISVPKDNIEASAPTPSTSCPPMTPSQKRMAATEDDQKVTPNSKKKLKKPSDLEKFLSSGTKLKIRLSNAQARFAAIIKSVKHDQSWAWAAKNEKMFLNDLIAASREAETYGSFVCDVMAYDMKVLRRKYADHELISGMKNMEEELEPRISKLESEVDVILSMHASRKGK